MFGEREKCVNQETGGEGKTEEEEEEALPPT